MLAQKPAIKQKDYNWDQEFKAIISDKGGFVLTQGNTGLYVYNTSSANTKFYSKAFNGKISSNEEMIVFRKPKDSLIVLNTRDNRMVNIDSVADFSLLNREILIRKVNGALYYFQDFKSRPISFSPVNKYEVDKHGTKVYYSNNDGFLISYSLLDKRVDTIFQGGDIRDFIIGKEIVVQKENEIIVIKTDKTQVSLSGVLDKQLEIADQPIQIELPTGKIYFRAVNRRKMKGADVGERYSDMQVWNYKDPYLYQMYLEENPDSSHYCLYDPGTGKIIDFGESQISYSPIKPDVANKFIIGLTPINAYERFWLKAARASCYLVNTSTGESKEIYHEMEGYYAMFHQLQLDPKQKYLLYYDLSLRNYRVYNIVTGTEAMLSKDTSLVLDNIDEDPASSPYPYGIAGWSADGKFVYVYDKYDLWKLDLEGKVSPSCVTMGMGSRTKRIFRIVNPGEDVYIREEENLLLSCFDVESRDNGFYELNIKKSSIRELIMDAHLYYNPDGRIQGEQPSRSLNKKYWLFQRMSASEYPNYFITKKFEKIIPVTQNEPQVNYNWMRSKVVKMGEVEGLLYLPEDFDPGKKYPIIFYLYQTFTDGVHQFIFPQLSDGTLNIPWYVSNGYLVLCPDVRYSMNEPGESVLRTVKIAKDYFSRQPYIDSLAIGLQGHSFGGYEVNYIVTHYNGFAAACAVSGASNLFTSYGNLRSGGTPGQVDFERGQFRMRKPIWEMPEVFLRNSPISSTNKVTTPLLLVSNKRDSSVLWSHAVEMFTAMRRQGKPCWLLQYDHSHHVIATEDRLDFSIRLQQYYDFYLKHLSEPEWMKVETRIRQRSKFPVVNY